MKYVLIVNGAGFFDQTVATDYAALLEQFAAVPDTKVYGYVGYDVTLATEEEKLLHSTEVESEELKLVFLGAVEVRARVIEVNDALMIVVLGHGVLRGSVNIAGAMMAKWDVLMALHPLRPDIKLWVVNMVCHSGAWEGAAFTLAFANTIQRRPDGTVKSVTTQIHEECRELADPGRFKSFDPVAAASNRGLWSTPISNCLRTVSLPTAVVQLSNAKARQSFQDRIKRWWWCGGNELPVTENPKLSSYGADVYDMALREEIEELESRAVGSSEATWISCTKLVLEGKANPELRARVQRTFEYMEAMKLRAMYAVRALVSESQVPANCNHDRYDLENLTHQQNAIINDLVERAPYLFKSQILPRSNTVGGNFSRHISWIACVLEGASREFKRFDLNDCIAIIEKFFIFERDTWMRLSFEGPAPVDGGGVVGTL